MSSRDNPPRQALQLVQSAVERRQHLLGSCLTSTSVLSKIFAHLSETVDEARGFCRGMILSRGVEQPLQLVYALPDQA